jgi:D-alanyl-D-alanine carboxypeptidase/D-alanyl-D-alanine-endopeptidase (penicillin-binding protein 4)
MQRYTIISFLFFFTFIIHSQNTVQREIDIFFNDKININSSISFIAFDLEKEEVVAKLNENKSLTSASTAKLFSTSTAFELLGSNYTTQTRIYYDGFIDKDSVLNGNIWIRGGGDVSLGSKYFNASKTELDFLNAWVDSLKNRGINRIAGAVIADGSEFGYNGAPEGWSWGDVGNYYGATASGINVFDNQILLYFKMGKAGSLSQITDIFPVVPGLKMRNEVYAAAVSGDDSYIYGAPFSFDRLVKGRLPQYNERFVVKGSMPDPEFQLAHEFTAVLIKKGIDVALKPKSFRLLDVELPNAYEKFNLLFSQPSKTVKEIAFWTNLKSVNLFAEGLLNQLGYLKTGNGSTESSLKVLESFWSNKIDFKGMILKDGSGLSRSNAISANHFCQLLTYMYKSSNFNDFKETLPVAGKTGTIASLCKGQTGEGRIFAKSGTISKVKAYAGYVYSKSGKKLAFSISINNYNGSSADLQQKIEKILNALASY